MPNRTVPPSRLEVAARAAGYLMVGMAGLWLWVFPPVSIGEVVWGVVRVALIVSLSMGLPAAYAAARYKYRREYMFLVPIATGIGVTALSMYSYAIINQRPTVVFFGLIISYLFFKIVSRFAALNRLIDAQLGGSD